MNTSCPLDIGYLDSPEFLRSTSHIITAISTPIHCISMYCILLKTPEQMKGVKLYFINLHVWIWIFDYFMSLLLIPFILFPFFVGFQLGILSEIFPINSFHVPVVLVVYTYVAIAVVAVFENRFYTVCVLPAKFKKLWGWFRKPWLAVHYPAVIAGVAPFVIFVPEQETAKKKVFEALACLPDYILNAPIFVFVFDNFIYSSFLLIPGPLIYAFEFSIFISFLIQNFYKQVKSRTISQKTIEMQKKFFVALLIQTLVPLALMVLPVTLIWIIVWKQYYSQALNNIVVVIVSTHGCVSSVVMILVHRPYRDTVLWWFSKKKRSSERNSERVIRKNTLMKPAQ